MSEKNITTLTEEEFEELISKKIKTIRFCCKVFPKIYFSIKLRKKTERTE